MVAVVIDYRRCLKLFQQYGGSTTYPRESLDQALYWLSWWNEFIKHAQRLEQRERKRG